jgi:hypothetical protein
MEVGDEELMLLAIFLPSLQNSASLPLSRKPHRE